jgi:phosphotransferase system HPr (HPr) family protein
MISAQVKIGWTSGLHARPVVCICRAAMRFKSDILITYHDFEVSAKSIGSLEMLAIGPGETVLVQANGADEEKALAATIAALRNDERIPW